MGLFGDCQVGVRSQDSTWEVKMDSFQKGMNGFTATYSEKWFILKSRQHIWSPSSVGKGVDPRARLPEF